MTYSEWMEYTPKQRFKRTIAEKLNVSFIFILKSFIIKKW
jgi:hypothetical protein